MERGGKKTRASFYFFGASSGLFTPLQDVAKFREGVSKNLTEGKKPTHTGVGSGRMFRN
ncbi:hypothetical protein SF123566_4972 [Shigella flexneri 1235-66]|nr:hypothetical protein SF123566_4972 [Shigella flexneri 1235-66]